VRVIKRGAVDTEYEKGFFTPRQRQVILLAASENNCNYSVPAHSTVLKSVLHTRFEIVAAIRKGMPVPDAKLDALVAPVKETDR
jgi:hypothetical protein